MKSLSPLCRAVLVASAILASAALLAWATPAHLDP